MKIKISDIESKLDYKIKRNITTIGLDTATTTGICILKTDNEYLHIDSLVLSFKTDDTKEKYNTIVKTFEKMIEDDMYVIIEDVFVGFNKDAALVLARFGGFAVSAAIRRGLNYEIISAKSARAKFKIDIASKEFKAKYGAGSGKAKFGVKDWIDGLNVDIKDHNIVDAFVLALLGLCEGMDFRSNAAIKKSNTKAKKKMKKSKRKNK